jgi:hypothetical protein
MSSKRVPKYRHHKPSGQAVVTLDGHDHYLGRHGTEASKQEYDRLIAEWLASGRRLPRGGDRLDGLSVNELLLAYVQFAELYYRHPDGRPTTEVRNIKQGLRPLKQLYGHTIAAAFDSLALETLREQMARDGRCRNRINKDVARIKRLFRWGTGKKLIPPAVYQGLQAVEGLRAGRSGARESVPVRPVPDAVVEATVPHLPRQVAALVTLQRLTGMRPGEAVVLRGIDLEMREQVWLYRPGSDRGPHGAHKNAYRGHQRVILIGPKGQEVLRPWLRLNLQEYLFQPREAVAEFRAELRKKRKTKVWPSQQNCRKRRPKRQPGEYYTIVSYAHAIYRACDLAFPPPAPLARQGDETKSKWGRRLSEEQKAELHAWRKRHRWHPNQLRHAKATEIRREAGLDAARVVLGHRSPQITEVYAEIDVNKAAEVMARLG